MHAMNGWQGCKLPPEQRHLVQVPPVKNQARSVEESGIRNGRAC